MQRPGLAICCFGLLLACGGAERRAADRKAVEELLAAYPAALSAAYSQGSSEPLRALVTPRELTRVEARIAELSDQGRGLRARLLHRRVAAIDLHSATSGTANVIETWNLRVVALGSEQMVSESPSQENELVYSLVRDQGRWWILSRQLKHSSEPES